MTTENEPDRRVLDEKRFKIDTTVTIAHMLTTLWMIVSLFSWGTDVKTAMATNRADITRNREDIEQAKVSLASQSAEVKAGLNSLNAKLDRLIEREYLTMVNKPARR